MAEYIEREALLQEDLTDKFVDIYDIEIFEYIIESAPIADVVEVVRCKDCKRCYEKRTKRNKQLMLFCMRMDGREYQVNANDFCSYGKRKGEGE